MFKRFGFFRDAASLANQWQVLVRMAITMARHVLRLEAARPREALKKAELLEAWLTCALTEVTQQIEAEDRAVHLARPFSQQLPPVAFILLCLLKTIRNIKARLRASLAAGHVFNPLPGEALPVAAPMAEAARRLHPP